MRKTQSFRLPGVALTIDANRGLLSLVMGRRIVRNIRPQLIGRIGGRVRALLLLKGGAVEQEAPGVASAAGRSIVVRARHGALETEYAIAVREGDPFVEMGCAVRAVREGVPAHVLSFTPLSVALSDMPLARVGRARLRFWHVPQSGWGGAATQPLAGKTGPDDAGVCSGYDFGGVFDPATGISVTVCHLLPTQWTNRLAVSKGRLELVSRVDVPLRPWQTLRSDRTFVNLAQPIAEALAAFAPRQKPRRRAVESREHWGWNSWDYYHHAISREAVRENMEAIRGHAWMRARIRHIIIDDGWQDLAGDCGDWDVDRAKFPDGMDGMAREIAAAGFVPGVWTAPFVANLNSRLMKAHPDWAVQYDGQPYSPWRLVGCEPVWGDRVYLDPTHPGVAEFIYGLYRRLRAWGFRYFKTDFLTNSIGAMFDGEQAKHREHVRFHDPGMGLQRAHRMCMQAIRAAIGEESFWLGCGTHFASGAGLVDGSRISSDISIHFPVLLKCARANAFHFHLHGGLFLMDPDFAVFRGRDTAKRGMLERPAEGTRPYDRSVTESGPTFNADEARLWATSIILCGGLVTLSDRIAGLNATGLGIVRTLLEHGGGAAAMPLDLENPLPTVLLKTTGQRTYLGLLNFDDGKDRVFDVRRFRQVRVPRSGPVTDVWRGEALPARELERVCVPPHAARLFVWG